MAQNGERRRPWWKIEWTGLHTLIVIGFVLIASVTAFLGARKISSIPLLEETVATTEITDAGSVRKPCPVALRKAAPYGFTAGERMDCGNIHFADCATIPYKDFEANLSNSSTGLVVRCEPGLIRKLKNEKPDKVDLCTCKCEEKNSGKEGKK